MRKSPLKYLNFTLAILLLTSSISIDARRSSSSRGGGGHRSFSFWRSSPRSTNNYHASKPSSYSGTYSKPYSSSGSSHRSYSSNTDGFNSWSNPTKDMFSANLLNEMKKSRPLLMSSQLKQNSYSQSDPHRNSYSGTYARSKPYSSSGPLHRSYSSNTFDHILDMASGGRYPSIDTDFTSYGNFEKLIENVRNFDWEQAVNEPEDNSNTLKNDSVTTAPASVNEPEDNSNTLKNDSVTTAPASVADLDRTSDWLKTQDFRSLVERGGSFNPFTLGDSRLTAIFDGMLSPPVVVPELVPSDDRDVTPAPAGAVTTVAAATTVSADSDGGEQPPTSDKIISEPIQAEESVLHNVTERVKVENIAFSPPAPPSEASTELPPVTASSPADAELTSYTTATPDLTPTIPIAQVAEPLVTPDLAPIIPIAEAAEPLAPLNLQPLHVPEGFVPLASPNRFMRPDIMRSPGDASDEFPIRVASGAGHIIQSVSFVTFLVILATN